MATFNFPTAPSTDATYTYLGKTWKYNGTGWVPVPKSVVNIPAGREMLLADRTYYVATTGSDSNTGLTIGTPFLTVQKAIDVIAATLDCGGFAPVIQVADGTYTGAINTKVLTGASRVRILGNIVTPANVIFNTTGTTVTSNTAGQLIELQGMKFISTIHALFATLGGTIEFGLVNFGVTSTFHIAANLQGMVRSLGNYTISGGAMAHIFAESAGVISISNRTITLTGIPAFSGYFAGGNFFGGILLAGNVYTGTATGKRYQVAANTAINAGGATLPGDVAGTTATGGQYT